MNERVPIILCGTGEPRVAAIMRGIAWVREPTVFAAQRSVNTSVEE